MCRFEKHSSLCITFERFLKFQWINIDHLPFSGDLPGRRQHDRSRNAPIGNEGKIVESGVDGLDGIGTSRLHSINTGVPGVSGQSLSDHGRLSFDPLPAASRCVPAWTISPSRVADFVGSFATAAAIVGNRPVIFMAMTAVKRDLRFSLHQLIALRLIPGYCIHTCSEVSRPSTGG